MLTVDYGDSMPAVYDRRPRGTLRAYAHHQRIEGPAIYQNFGQQDLTADVNFTDLQVWGAALGLKTERFCTQAEFLRSWSAGTLDKMLSTDPALAFLMDEAGPGGAFKVLEQVKTSVLLRTDQGGCQRRDLNPYSLRNQILSLARLPFRHFGFSPLPANQSLTGFGSNRLCCAGSEQLTENFESRTESASPVVSFQSLVVASAKS